MSICLRGVCVCVCLKGLTKLNRLIRRTRKHDADMNKNKLSMRVWIFHMKSFCNSASRLWFLEIRCVRIFIRRPHLHAETRSYLGMQELEKALELSTRCPERHSGGTRMDYSNPTPCATSAPPSLVLHSSLVKKGGSDFKKKGERNRGLDANFALLVLGGPAVTWDMQMSLEKLWCKWKSSP